jgi:hypothetical protein
MKKIIFLLFLACLSFGSLSAIDPHKAYVDSLAELSRVYFANADFIMSQPKTFFVDSERFICRQEITEVAGRVDTSIMSCHFGDSPDYDLTTLEHFQVRSVYRYAQLPDSVHNFPDTAAGTLIGYDSIIVMNGFPQDLLSSVTIIFGFSRAHIHVLSMRPDENKKPHLTITLQPLVFKFYWASVFLGIILSILSVLLSSNKRSKRVWFWGTLFTYIVIGSMFFFIGSSRLLRVGDTYTGYWPITVTLHWLLFVALPLYIGARKTNKS